MRYLLLCGALALFLTAPCAYAQTRTTFGDRLGTIIEPAERSYFGLFPSFYDFIHAQIGTTRGDSIELLLTHGSPDHPHDTTLVVPADAVTELGRYAAEFEHLYEVHGVEKALNWDVLRPLARPSGPLGDKPMELCVELNNSETACGLVAFISDSALVLYSGDFPVDWHHMDFRSRVVRPGEIMRIYHNRKFLGPFFGRLDLPLSGNDSVYRTIVMPYVADRAILFPRASPELVGLIDDALAKPVVHGGATAGTATVADIERALALGAFHVKASYGWLTPVESDVATIQLGSFPRVQQRLATLPTKSIGIECGYGITPRIRGGLIYEHYPAVDTVFGVDQDYDLLSGFSLAAVMDFALISRGTYFTSFLDHFEFLVGIGAMMFVMDIESRMTDPRPSGTDITSHTSPTRTGFFSRGAMAYYLSRNLALELEARMTVALEFTIDKQVIWTQHAVPYVLKSIDSHTARWSSVGPHLSIRYSF